jgi:hypothetical protein
MAVYVYKYGGQGPKAMTDAWPHPLFGLTADTEEELHPFAEGIGMYRRSTGPSEPDRRYYRSSAITTWTKENTTSRCPGEPRRSRHASTTRCFASWPRSAGSSCPNGAGSAAPPLLRTWSSAGPEPAARSPGAVHPRGHKDKLHQNDQRDEDSGADAEAAGKTAFAVPARRPIARRRPAGRHHMCSMHQLPVGDR